MKTIAIVITFCAATLLIGCASHPRHPTNTVCISSINNGNTYSNQTYRLLSGDNNITEDNLQFKEFARILENPLALKGYTPAPIGQMPDVAIYLRYGTSGPIDKTEQYTVPIFGQTGVSSSYTSGTISTLGNTSFYSGHTMHNPTYGITGFSQNTRTVTMYGCHILITGLLIDNNYAETGGSTEIWRTMITCYGKEGDLRLLFPRLIYCAKDYISEDTGKTLETSVRTDSYYTIPTSY